MARGERAVDRGTARGRRLIGDIGRECRTARLDRGLSTATAGRAIGRSASWVSRAERGLSPTVGVLELARLCAVVGLDLSIRAFPGAGPLRDSVHAALLGSFRDLLHHALDWAGEVPLPGPGDLRAWDALIRGDGWRYGVEAETSPHDAQATARRLLLKARDGGVDGVLLVVPATRQARIFLAEFAVVAGASFPVPGRTALEALRAGRDPGGNAVIVVPRHRRLATPAT